MKRRIPGMGDALLVVDVQNDFLPGGHPAVPQGDKISLHSTAALPCSQKKALPVYASRDRHPADHCSCLARGKSISIRRRMLRPMLEMNVMNWFCLSARS